MFHMLMKKVLLWPCARQQAYQHAFSVQLNLYAVLALNDDHRAIKRLRLALSSLTAIAHALTLCSWARKRLSWCRYCSLPGGVHGIELVLGTYVDGSPFAWFPYGFEAHMCDVNKCHVMSYPARNGTGYNCWF